MSSAFIDPATLPHTGGGVLQLCSLILVYGYILCTASGWIGDGSELLLLIPSVAGVVGSVVLPILGAVPDGAIVLFSGMGPDAQNQLNIGIGALAGSTVMLLTVPWALCIIAGRVHLDAKGQGLYNARPKLRDNQFSGTGVTCNTEVIFYAAKWMIITSVSLLIVQGSAFAYHCGTYVEVQKKLCMQVSERQYALLALATSLIGFIGYCYDQLRLGNSQKEEKLDAVRKKALTNGQITLRGIFATEGGLQESSYGTIESKPSEAFRSVCKVKFQSYDTDGSNTINSQELVALLKDLGEAQDVRRGTLSKLIKGMDKDGSGSIEFEEFVTAMHQYVHQGKFFAEEDGAKEDEKEEGDSEEETEIPDDLINMPVDQQRRRIVMRSCFWMFSGVAVVLIFSDPLVDVLGELGDRLGVSPFYISFVFCPLASNASEIIASYRYAQKKTAKTMTVSFSALLGAAIMNNTFCLLIFLILIVSKQLIWEFSAETLCILFVEVCMYFVATRNNHPTWMALVVLALFPISLIIVVVAEKAGLN